MYCLSILWNKDIDLKIIRIKDRNFVNLTIKCFLWQFMRNMKNAILRRGVGGREVNRVSGFWNKSANNATFITCIDYERKHFIINVYIFLLTNWWIDRKNSVIFLRWGYWMFWPIDKLVRNGLCKFQPFQFLWSCESPSISVSRRNHTYIVYFFYSCNNVKSVTKNSMS